MAWQGGRARSGTEPGDSGDSQGESQGVCGPVPGSHAGSTLHMLGISERQASHGEAPGGLPAGSCPQPGYGGLSPAAAPEVAAPEMGARGLSQRMLTPLMGLCSTGGEGRGGLHKEGLAAGRRCWVLRASPQLPQPACWALIPLPASCLGSFPGIFHRLGYIWDRQPITPFLTDSPAGAWLQQEAQREWGQRPETVLPSIILLQTPFLG